tara:strand:+ start:282 stop:422 length:141 start_codon:yes stop_codon:yes gene_type:complete
LASAKRLDCLRILSEKHGQLAADLGQRLADLAGDTIDQLGGTLAAA